MMPRSSAGAVPLWPAALFLPSHLEQVVLRVFQGIDIPGQPVNGRGGYGKKNDSFARHLVQSESQSFSKTLGKNPRYGPHPIYRYRSRNLANIIEEY